MQVAIRVSRKETNSGWFNYIRATVHRWEIRQYCYLQFLTFDWFNWIRNESGLFIVWLIDYVTLIVAEGDVTEYAMQKCTMAGERFDFGLSDFKIYFNRSRNPLINLIQMFFSEYIPRWTGAASCISPFDRFFWYSWNTLFEQSRGRPCENKESCWHLMFNSVDRYKSKIFLENKTYQMHVPPISINLWTVFYITVPLE